MNSSTLRLILVFLLLVAESVFAAEASLAAVKRYGHLALAEIVAAQNANEFDAEGHAQKAKDLIEQLNRELKLPVISKNSELKTASSGRHPHLAVVQRYCQLAMEEIVAAQNANEFDREGHAQKAKDLIEQLNRELKLSAQAISPSRVLTTESPEGAFTTPERSISSSAQKLRCASVLIPVADLFLVDYEQNTAKLLSASGVELKVTSAVGDENFEFYAARRGVVIERFIIKRKDLSFTDTPLQSSSPLTLSLLGTCTVEP